VVSTWENGADLNYILVASYNRWSLHAQFDVVQNHIGQITCSFELDSGQGVGTLDGLLKLNAPVKDSCKSDANNVLHILVCTCT
jgi:hypothetical protein